MRAVSVFAAALLAYTVAAGNSHEQNRAHLRRQRAWGRRAMSSSIDDTSDSTAVSAGTATAAPAATGTILTEVPANVQGAVTVSNTQAADPQSTASAVGADRGGTSPLPACSPNGGFMASCDPSTGNCCKDGLTCANKRCIRLCTVPSTEPYCDAAFPCDESLGYTCTNNRCRPPVTAIRVDIGQMCDQGTGNTQFCIPARALCVAGKCEPCVQSS